MNRKITFDSILKLVAVKSTGQNDIGIPNKKESERSVYCKVLPIGQNADFQARQLGVKWDKKFAIHSFEYNGEQIVIHNGIRYSVERVYGENLNEVELTCSEI